MPAVRRPLPGVVASAVVFIAVSVAALPAIAVLRGPDVSGWDHPSGHTINWRQVRAAGAAFVFIKAAEGTHYVNPHFQRDWAASGRAGLIRGAYDFARPSRRPGSGAAQGRYFVHVIRATLTGSSLPPALDLEVSGGLSPRRLIAWTRDWLTIVHRLTGRLPMIYSYRSFWRFQMAGTKAFRRFPLWAACLCRRPSTFGGAWTRWTFWQYSDASRVVGIAAQADMNRFNGTMTQLRALAAPPQMRRRRAPSPAISPPAPSALPSATTTAVATTG